jgi:hypothetical protein
MSRRNPLPTLGALTLSLFAGVAGASALTPDEQAATQNAFARAMRNNDFVVAARAGDAPLMKDLLVENGAPAGLDLVAQGIRITSTPGAPEPSQSLNNGGICVRWKLVTWYNPVTHSYYTMWVCTQIISSSSGIVTYDSPL